MLSAFSWCQQRSWQCKCFFGNFPGAAIKVILGGAGGRLRAKCIMFRLACTSTFLEELCCVHQVCRVNCTCNGAKYFSSRAKTGHLCKLCVGGQLVPEPLQNLPFLQAQSLPVAFALSSGCCFQGIHQVYNGLRSST